MPITWSEVEDRKLKPQRYRMKDAIRAVERGDDPWKGWRRHARSLKQPRRKLDRLL
jgi:DNA primase